ncbi:MAG: hypothetical protein M5U01_11305 [Ardenticatenaceae bacterium]|nr:hypothetical protein [Ardenticatenaceae bacterium]
MSTLHLTSTELEQITADLHRRGLAVPAWLVLECLRPLSWLLGQATLVAQPLLHGVGLGPSVDRLIALLDDPAALASISQALAPDEVTR